MKTRVLVLGGTGMLGSMVAGFLACEPELDVAATARSEDMPATATERVAGVRWETFDATAAATANGPVFFREYDWVVNCIGIIKPLIHEDNPSEVEQALRVNSLFPHSLARWTQDSSRVIQIATDCVYSGTRGHYAEDDPHDALDVYGKTKSLGEVCAPNVHNLRCSIVGPELKSPKSLLEWFLGQPEGQSVNGFVNHNWNGITTLHFARICGGIIKREVDLPHLQHVIPGASITKYEMLEHFGRHYKRNDLKVIPTEAATVIDRTLRTNDEKLNLELWSVAGYEEPPTVPQMIAELAQSQSRSRAESVYARD